MEFQRWGETPRLFHDKGIVITEKLDGTNAAVIIEPVPGDDIRAVADADVANSLAVVRSIHGVVLVGAQSRNKLLTLAEDNAGFAAWVFNNALTIANDLGYGRHFGEWWGNKIQRGYGLLNASERYFSLFNVAKWAGANSFFSTEELGVVPVLYDGPFSQIAINVTLFNLQQQGSRAYHGYMRPEGIVIYHRAANQVFKVTFDGDRPKWETLAAAVGNG